MYPIRPEGPPSAVLRSLYLAGGLVAAAVSANVGAVAGQASAPSSQQVTFTRDVAPILYRSCASCHRPGEIGPMALLTYEQVRPWARVIEERVSTRAMPPWHADPEHGVFLNDRRLSEEEIRTIVAWVNDGAPQGESRHLPPLPEFTEGWTIGEPDIVFTIDPFDVPAEGVIDYINIRVPTNFTEDRYIVAAEVRPGNRSVVHHVQVSIVSPALRTENRDASLAQENRLAGYTPGHNALELRPGVAKLIPAGSVLNFNMHYTTNRTPATDQTSIGLIFTREPVEKRLRTRMAATGNIDIPPHAARVEGRVGFEFPYDAMIEALRPHMHERGKDMRYALVLPDGTEQTLLWIPDFDFAWQTNYVLKEPVFAPKGSRIDVVAHWDNSAENPRNPDPTVRVRYGEQSWEEMLAAYVEYTLVEEDLRAVTTRID